ncbi:hypothetical protein FRC09_005820 [Ceratobasidium sp. 395]|nr:hypothetical protein FRC09_005820 [Ceratobasidium sp. 395]
MLDSFYETQLAVLASYAFVAILLERYISKRHTAAQNKDASDPLLSGKTAAGGGQAAAKALSLKYLAVYAVVMAADWLQGPYVYSLYKDQYGYSEQMVAVLFVTGFLSAGLSAPTVVSAAQNDGVSSSDLSAIFGSATMINGLVAAAVGVFSNGLVARTQTFTSPFVVSALCLGVSWILIAALWSENYGTRSESATTDLLQIKRLGEAWAIVRDDPSLIVLGLVQTCFEGSMYLFVFLWVPSMQEAAYGESLPLGLIFSAFMVSMMLGSLLYKSLVTYCSAGESTLVLHAKLSSFTLLTAAFALAVNNLAHDVRFRFWAFCMFEACVGVYYPVQGMLRGTMIQNDHRATLSSLFRIPLNIFVVVALMSGVSSARHLVFTACSLALAFGSVMTSYVIVNKATELERESPARPE